MNSRLEISEGALRGNFRAYRKMTSARILQVVKANAYGHGLENVVTCLAKEQIDAFGVVNVSEALRLRQVNRETTVFLLGVVPLGDFEAANATNSIVPVWRKEHIEAAQAASKTTGRKTRVQIKIDTGMGRLGLFADKLGDLLDQLAAATDEIDVAAVYTHFHTADGLEETSYLDQLALFKTCAQKVKERFGDHVIAHAANSPGFLRDDDTHLDMVRIGIAGYGIPPDLGFELPSTARPAARWVSALAEVKDIPKGHGVSYGGEFRAPSDMSIGIVPVGYADGFRRVPRAVNRVSISGQDIPVIGRVCMDHFVVDLTQIARPGLGQEVELLGNSMGVDNSATVLANRWGTNEYDVLANVGQRVERVLVD